MGNIYENLPLSHLLVAATAVVMESDEWDALGEELLARAVAVREAEDAMAMEGS